MPPRLLTAAEFHACFAAPMQDVTAEAEPAADIWPYVDALDLPEVHDVCYVYRDARGRYDQVLIGTGRFNTLLVIVVDREAAAVLGHHLLDLGATD